MKFLKESFKIVTLLCEIRPHVVSLGSGRFVLHDCPLSHVQRGDAVAVAHRQRNIVKQFIVTCSEQQKQLVVMNSLHTRLYVVAE